MTTFPADPAINKALEGERFWSSPSIMIDDAPLHKAFNPDEPRDGHGEWTSGGGSSGATHGTKVVDGKRVMADGKPLPEHIAAIRIPPAWTDVQISPDASAKLWVVGKDAKGRRQAIYSNEFASQQARDKFERIGELNSKFDDIKAQNDDNRNSPDAKIREHADALHVIMATGIRPGSEDDTGAKVQAYGATTLLGQHVVSDDSGTRLVFTGKKGVGLNLPVDDKLAAGILQERAAHAGPDGQLFPRVTDASLRDYVHTMDGGGFKTKDFRTVLGTRTAMAEVSKHDVPRNAKDYQRSMMAVAKTVSTRLGNTPTVALQSYISPGVFAGWRQAAGV